MTKYTYFFFTIGSLSNFWVLIEKGRELVLSKSKAFAYRNIKFSMPYIIYESKEICTYLHRKNSEITNKYRGIRYIPDIR